MEEVRAVDKQGRVVLPSRMRESLGLKSGGDVVIRIDGSHLIIEPRTEEVDKKVDEWDEVVRLTESPSFAEDRTESWKWMSPEYSKRKLGLGLASTVPLNQELGRVKEITVVNPFPEETVRRYHAFLQSRLREHKAE